MKLLYLSFATSLLGYVAALGSSCSAPLSPSAAPGDPYWLQNIGHLGTAAFNANPTGYQVFRNVKTFGAKGDGTLTLPCNWAYIKFTFIRAQVVLTILSQSTMLSLKAVDAEVHRLVVSPRHSLQPWYTFLRVPISSAPPLWQFITQRSSAIKGPCQFLRHPLDSTALLLSVRPMSKT